MDNDIAKLLMELRSAPHNTCLVDALTDRVKTLSEKVEHLTTLQEEINHAYQAVVLIGNIIQKVSIDGQPLPQDFGLHFAGVIHQLVIAQGRVFNARNN